MDLVSRFRAAGLDVRNPRPITRRDDPLAPAVAVEGTRFDLPSLAWRSLKGLDAGGRAYTFASNENRDRMADYYVSRGRRDLEQYSHVVEGHCWLVQLSGGLSDREATRYRKALAEVP
jgi:hypothetical protein